MPEKALMKAEKVLCCNDCEKPLLVVVHLACTHEGMKELETLVSKFKSELIDINGVFIENGQSRCGSGQYCAECRDYKIGDVEASQLFFCPKCNCKLNENNKEETQAQCPECGKFFKVT